MRRHNHTPSFSIGWFFTFMILNIVGTVFLGLMAFGTAMSAFSASSASVKSGLSAIEGFSWIWTTGTMIAAKCFGLTYEKGLFGITILWAFVIGTIAGFLMPRFIQRSKDRSSTCIDAPPPEKW